MTVKMLNIIYMILMLILCLIPIIFLFDEELYHLIIMEDGVIEYLTASFLLFASIKLFFLFLKIYKKYSVFNFGLLSYSLVLFFGFGEEISWGQRIFGIQPPSFFSDNNFQGEINIHNMMVLGVDLNRWIFTYALVLIFTFYFLITPIMYYKNKLPKTIVNRFSFLIPNYLYSSIFLITTLIINLNLAEKVSEVWECSFAITIFFICFNSLNKKGN
tara:strand:- start:878 stop:1525 length:648 start_codon:yes stop_codon:yes gene_type:complete